MEDEEDDYGRGPGDYGLQRTTSILRNGGKKQSRGASAQPASVSSSRLRSASQGSRVAQPVHRERSISRDPQPRRDRVVPRGRTRSRSIGSQSGRERSPSLESQISLGTKDSSYTKDGASIGTLSNSLGTKESEYTPPEIKEKDRSRRKKAESSREQAEPPPVPKPAPQKTLSKRGLFGRMRSNSKQKVTEEAKIAVVARPTPSRRSTSKVSLVREKPVPEPLPSKRDHQRARSSSRHRDDSKDRQDRGSKKDRDAPKERDRGDGRDRQRHDGDTGSRRESGRDRDRKRDKYADDDDLYEEEETRSIVPLNMPSDESLSEPEEEIMRPPMRGERSNNSVSRYDRGGSSARSSSIPTRSALKPLSSSRRSSGGSRQSSSRAPPPPPPRSSRARSSSRKRDEDYDEY